MARSDNSQPTQQQFAHQRLRVYESAAGFVKLAHQLANGLPTGNAALSDQLRRASISVCLNIAEGAGEYRDGLAEHLVDHGFRLKSVHQAILNSRAYQLTSVPHPGNKLDNPRFFTHYNVRILPAEALLDALSQVTGVEHSFDLYPKGTRAQDINHRDYPGYFLDVFGFLNRLSLEERSKKPSLSQALHMMFGDTVMDKLQSDENVVSKLLESGKSDEEINQHLLIRAYSRKPISREKEQMKQYVATMSAHGIERKKIHDDLLWVVVNSKEFLVNH